MAGFDRIWNMNNILFMFQITEYIYIKI